MDVLIKVKRANFRYKSVKCLNYCICGCLFAHFYVITYFANTNKMFVSIVLFKTILSSPNITDVLKFWMLYYFII